MFGSSKNKRALMPMPEPQPEAMPAPRRGLFGGRSNMGLADFIMLAGATAKDISDGGTANFGGVMDYVGKRQAQQQQAALGQQAAALFSGGGSGGSKARVPQLAALQAAGYDIRPLIQLAELDRPKNAYHNGIRYDEHGDDAPDYIPNTPEGAVPLYTPDKKFAGFMTAQGYIPHVAETEAAKERAKGMEYRTIPRGDGGNDVVPIPRGAPAGTFTGAPPAAAPMGAPMPAPAAPEATVAAGPNVGYRDAIASIESRGSGDYSALGPVTRKGDRAYGRYQVMGSNIGPWTKQVLGREMSPQEFLADPQAQDAVFDGIFGGYVQQYGSPEEAASVWFTGRPMAEGRNRSDVNGMTGARYVDRFSQALGSQSGALQGGAGGDTLAAPAPQAASGPAPFYSTPGKPRDPAFKPSEALSAQQGLKKDFEGLPQVRVFRETAATYNTLRGLQQKGPKRTGADDIAGIFMFMKMLDPTSAVREGEYATAANSGGIPDWVQNLYNRAKDGERLTEGQFSNFVSSAAQLVLSRRDQYDQAATAYRSLAGQNGFNPELIAPMPKWERPQQVQARMGRNPPPQKGAGGKRLSPQEAAKLPKGTRFIGQDGVERERQ